MSGKPSYSAPLPVTITRGMNVVDVSDNGGVIAGITEDSVIYRPTLAPDELLVGRWTDVAICGLVPARNLLPDSPDDRTRTNGYAHLLEQLLCLQPAGWTATQRAAYDELLAELL